MPASEQKIIHLRGQHTSLVIGAYAEGAQLLYWGQAFSAHIELSGINDLLWRQEAPSSPATEPALPLAPTVGQGFVGQPGVCLSSDSDQWAFAPELVKVEQSGHQVTLTSEDHARALRLMQSIQLDADSDVVSFTSCIENLGKEPVNVEWCAAASLPLPAPIDTALSLVGAWAQEFQPQRQPLGFGSLIRENRKGRTSHDNFPGLLLENDGTNESQGPVYGLHLGWSGNHRMAVYKLGDGRQYAQAGELLLPGEVRLGPNESYTSPTLYGSFSHRGRSQLSRQFHRFVRQHLLSDKVKQRPRPVHYNTWEALYFDHDLDTLKDLATRAQAVGVERFVLDDGWFVGRNNDKAGLGDWYVDTHKYPEGLGPLVEYVNDLGMEFGLWVEPEMVNPDSDLFRQHPDWALACGDNPQLAFRHQLVLDLSQTAVQDYLYERLSSLLSEYPIGYLKWDMNRDLNHPGNAQGNPSVGQQTHALYALLDKLRKAFPNVEIESCASGGGRADFGILARTDRVWTSDNNDALERLKIQRGFSYFLPAELMGSHVGPRDCHITGRRLPMLTRAAVALFGHMGMEMDLRELTDVEQTELTKAVSLYKQHRELIHSGNLVRLDTPEYINAFGIIDNAQTQALYSYHLTAVHPSALPGRLYFAGLSEHHNYRLRVLWPSEDTPNWPGSVVFNFDNNLARIHNQVFSGELLGKLGLEMPLLKPQYGLVFLLDKV